MRGAVRGCHIELDAGLEGELQASASPHVVLADRLVRAIQILEPAVRSSTLSSSIFRKAGQRGYLRRTRRRLRSS